MAERLSPEFLRYARAVGDTGSFSAAARAYGITQPALSNGIAKLEEHLGERLFTRSPRGVTPTPFGVRMLPLIERAVSALDGVLAEAKRWNTYADESIRVGVSPLIDSELVARVYNAVCNLPAPLMSKQLVLREANLAELREGLISEELDMIVAPSVAPMPGYEHRVVDSEPLVLVESASEIPEPVKLLELADRQLILLPDTCGLTTFTHDLLKEHSLPVNAYPGQASSYRVLEEWANLGLGSAMLPESRLTEPDTCHRLVLDEEGQVVEVFYEAVWDPASSTAEELRVLADRLVQPVY